LNPTTVGLVGNNSGLSVVVVVVLLVVVLVVVVVVVVVVDVDEGTDSSSDWSPKDSSSYWSSKPVMDSHPEKGSPCLNPKQLHEDTGRHTIRPQKVGNVLKSPLITLLLT
jgi:hypothetical protein